MAYDEFLADRIRHIINASNAPFYEKKMMGGLIFMVNDKMSCGTHYDKKFKGDLLMVKIGIVAYEEEIEKDVCLPMDFTGRPMRGYIFITPDGFDMDEDLKYWVQKGLDFNKISIT